MNSVKECSKWSFTWAAEKIGCLLLLPTYRICLILRILYLMEPLTNVWSVSVQSLVLTKRVFLYTVEFAESVDKQLTCLDQREKKWSQRNTFLNYIKTNQYNCSSFMTAFVIFL